MTQNTEAFEECCTKSKLIFTDEDFKRRALYWFEAGQRHRPSDVTAVLEAARKLDKSSSYIGIRPHESCCDISDILEAIRNHDRRK